jgi:[ribosomal protein S5]-alanine N-acetyltransferase
MSGAVLSTGSLNVSRIGLRPVEMSDAPAIQAYVSDPRIAATTTIPHPYPATGAEEFIASRLAMRAAGTGETFAILRDATPIGLIGFHGIDSFGKAEIGYWIAVPFWNQGIATAAGMQAVARAFQELALSELYAPCLKSNIASARVLEKLGFTEQGPFIHDASGKPEFTGQPMRAFRLLRADWERRHSA